MKKLIMLSPVLLGIIFLVGCGQQQVSQTQPIIAPVVQQLSTEQPIVTRPTVNQQASTAAEDKQSYFEIKELNLKFPVDAVVASDIKYEIKNENGNMYAIFSSKKLQGKESDCTTEVVLLKILGKPSDNPDFARYSKDSFVQFDGFFTMAVGPQDSCSTNEKIKAMAAEFVKNIIAGLNNVSDSKSQ